MPATHRRLTLDDLRRFAHGRGLGTLHAPADAPDWSAPLGPATNDSRAVAPGGLFVALQGERADGHRFVPDAIARGAAAAIVSRLPEDVTPDVPGRWATADEHGAQPTAVVVRYHATAVAGPTTAVAGPDRSRRPPDRMQPVPIYWLVPNPLVALQELARWWRMRFPDLPVIGITGSVGKTTAKETLAAALGTLLPVLASPKSFNNEIGLPLTLLSLDGGHRAAILEMGIYDVGDIAFLSGIAHQTIGVVLNVDAVHLERAGSIERIAQAKAEMVETLPPHGTAVLNHDDPRVRAMASAAPGPVRTFGLAEGADWRAVDLRPRPDGLDLTLLHHGQRYPLRSALPGRHSAYALLAAAAAMEALGIAPERIAQALAAVPAPAARQRFIRRADGALVIDDTYNASPLSMLAALDLLAAQPAARRIAILADMLELGPLAEESHRRVGERAGQVADIVVAVGPLARHIAEAAGPRARHVAEKAALRDALADLARPGDAILVKGSRGMAMEDVVAWLCQQD